MVEQRRRGDGVGGPDEAAVRLRPPRRAATSTPGDVDQEPVLNSPATVVAGVAAVGTVAACVAVGAGAPVLGHGWQVEWFAGGAIVAAWALWWSWRRRRSLGRRTMVAAAAAAVAVFGLFTWGAATTILIDGRPVLTTSTEAQAWLVARDLYSDLVTMAAYDELLALPIAGARAEYERYETAGRDMERLNRKWTARLDNLPGDAFRPAVEAARDAAYWGSQALDAKARTVVQTDSALETEARSTREAYAGFVLQAGRLLQEASSLYGTPLSGSQAGPVE